MGCLLIAAIFSAALGMFQFGFNTGALNAPQSEVQEFLKSSFKKRYRSDITDEQAGTYFSVAVSIFSIAGMVGALSAGWMAEKKGRRKSLMYVQGISVAAGICMGVSKVASSYELLLIGRCLVGLACGLFTGLSPLYMSEIAPVKMRGALGTVNQLAVTIGLFTSMILGLRAALGGHSEWPILLSFTILPAVVQAVLLMFVPESPRYSILTEGKVEDGKAALRKLLGKDDVEDDLRQILEERNASAGLTSISVLEVLKSPDFRLAMFVCICLHLSQQLSGILAIFYYSTKVFEGAGIDCDSSQSATLFVGAIMVVMTLVTIPLMDRLGRRVLHLVGLAGIIICSILITVALKLTDGDAGSCSGDEDADEPIKGEGIFLIVATLTFVVFFAMGPGSIPWMAAGDLFGQSARSAATSVSVFVNWLGNLFVALVFPQLQNNLKVYSFVPFLISSCIFFIILFFYFPETKNQKSKDIEEIFRVKNAWKTPIGLKSSTLLKQLQRGEVQNF